MCEVRSWRWTALLAMTLTTCSGARGALRVTRDGVVVQRIERVSGDEARGRLRVGDFEIRDDRVRAVFTASDDDPSGAGALRFVATDNPNDPGLLGPLRPVWQADGREVTVLHGTVESIFEQGLASVRWRGEVATSTGVVLEVERDARIDPTDHSIVWETRVRRRSPGAPIMLSAGVDARIAAGTLFAPGVGLITAATDANVPWMAVAGEHEAWALLTRGDSLRMHVDARGEEDREPAHATMMSEAHSLAAGQTATFQLRLVGGRGDLADVAAASWRAHGESLVEAPMRVSADESCEHMFVVITQPNGTTLLVVDMTRGQSRTVLLPQGEYVAYAFAHGHSTSDPVHFTAGPRAEPLALQIPAGGVIRVTVSAGSSGPPLPSRIVVRGIAGTPDPQLGPLHRATGAGQIVIAASGRAEFTVPPGDYEVTASHGPEWSIAQIRTHVTATMRGDVRLSLVHAIPMDDWTACDLHVHSIPSGDSEVSIADRVASLVSEGVEFAAATEHNTVGDYGPGIESLPRTATLAGGGTGLVWVPAVEVTTDRSPQPIGHFNVYPYAPDASEERGGPPPFDGTPSAIFHAARAREADGVIQVNHPRMEPGIGYFDRVALDPRTNTARSPLYDPNYDAVEVFNGYYIGVPREVDRVLRDWFALLSTGAHYVGTASSDSHGIAYFAAGYPRTYVYTPGAGDRSPDAHTVIASLRAGHAFGSSGPMLFARVGEAFPGDTVHTEDDHVDLAIEVRAAPWIDVDEVIIHRDGEPIETIAVPAGHGAVRLHRTVSIPLLLPRTHLVVTARGRQGSLENVLPRVDAVPFAFTNPIWIERPGLTARASTRPARSVRHRPSPQGS